MTWLCVSIQVAIAACPWDILESASSIVMIFQRFGPITQSRGRAQEFPCCFYRVARSHQDKLKKYGHPTFFGQHTAIETGLRKRGGFSLEYTAVKTNVDGRMDLLHPPRDITRQELRHYTSSFGSGVPIDGSKPL